MVRLETIICYGENENTLEKISAIFLVVLKIFPIFQGFPKIACKIRHSLCVIQKLGQK